MGKREYQSWPSVDFETDRGLFKVSATSATTMYVQTQGDGVLVRNVPIGGSEHWNLREDGTWEGHYEKPESRFSFTGKRLDRNRMVPDDATHTQSKALYEVLRETALAFAEAHPELMLRGEVASANNDIERIEKDMAKLQADLDALAAKRAEKLARERAALDALDELAPAAPGMR